MFDGHDPYLVALSVVIAILGGYTGFGLAARIRATPALDQRVLLSGAAIFLAVGIWTMHFIGMLAAPIPADAVYLVLPTIISFLICVLVVGISLFFVSIGEPSLRRVISSAVLLGLGIASMHYVGMHGLSGSFGIRHDVPMVLLSVLVGIVSAYGGLRAFLARQDGLRLVASSIAFGIAVSGMHYTAMAGMHVVPLSADVHPHIGGLAASQQMLSIIVAVLCFVIAAGFLLSLVPEPRRQPVASPAEPPVLAAIQVAEVAIPESGARSRSDRRRLAAVDAGAARRSRSAAARCARAAPAGGGRRWNSLHRCRRHQERARRCTLYKSA